MPFQPRYATIRPDSTLWEDLRAFTGRFEDIWKGPWTYNEQTAEAGHAYAQALVMPSPRKSMEPLASNVDENRHQFYQFITRSPWDWQAAQDRIIDVGREHDIFTKKGGLYLDDTALPKKGTQSVGVKRQWCGVLGKTENCQVLPTLVWGAPQPVNRDSVTWPLGMRLYLPEDWAADDARRKEAGVPEDVSFQTKAQLALAMLARVRERVLHGFIGADAFYGRDSAFRQQLRQWEEAYVVGLQPQQFHCVLDAPGSKDETVRSAAEWASLVTWRRVTWSQGSKEPLTAKVARLRVRVTLDGKLTEERGWLLLEEREGEVKAWVCWRMDKASLKALVTRAHHRWVIEDFFGVAKGELGLDHFEGRKWMGLHHHVTMGMVAFGFLAVKRVGLRASRGRKTRKRSSIKGEAQLPPIRAVVRALEVMRFAVVLEAVLGVPRSEAEKHAPVMLRMLGVQV